MVFFDNPVEKWDQEVVATWLRTADPHDPVLAQYAELFVANNIDGRTLLELEDYDLTKIGVYSVGHRKSIMRAINRLKNNEWSTPKKLLSSGRASLIPGRSTSPLKRSRDSEEQVIPRSQSPFLAQSQDRTVQQTPSQMSAVGQILNETALKMAASYNARRNMDKFDQFLSMGPGEAPRHVGGPGGASLPETLPEDIKSTEAKIAALQNRVAGLREAVNSANDVDNDLTQRDLANMETNARHYLELSRNLQMNHGAQDDEVLHRPYLSDVRSAQNTTARSDPRSQPLTSETPINDANFESSRKLYEKEKVPGGRAETISSGVSQNEAVSPVHQTKKDDSVYLREEPAYDGCGGVILVIVLNRPQVHNAIDPETMAKFRDVVVRIDDVMNDKVRAIILTGSGNKSFCSGADLRATRSLVSEKDAVWMSYIMGDALSTLESFAVPVIAAVNGYAIGGGCELALACDMRVVDENCKMGMPHVKNGITPPWGGTNRLRRICGYSKAMEYLLDPTLRDVMTLKEDGLVNSVVPVGEAYPYAITFARKICGGATDAIRGIKKNLREFEDIVRERGAQKSERDTFTPMWTSSDHWKRVETFVGNR